MAANKERFLRISRRVSAKNWVKVVQISGAIVFAFLICALISTLENHITSLARKYDTTYTELETNIDDAENSLALMMDDLTGNEFDVQGLTQLKKLFSCVSLDN